MTDDHLSLDELAELDEGLLSAERIAAFREHLAGCDICRAGADAISATRTMLSDLPPVAMPTDVRDRLDRAIAAAADADRAAADAETAAQRPSPVAEPVDPSPVDISQRTPEVMPAPGTVVHARFGRPTAASSAVAAAIALVVGAIVVAHFHHGNSVGTPAGPQLGASSHAFAGNLISPDQPATVVKSFTGLTYTTVNLPTTVKGLLARAPGALSPSAVSSPGRTIGSATPGTGGGSNGTDVKPAGGSASSHRLKENEPRPSASATRAVSTLESSPIPAVLRPLAHSQKRILACAVTLTGQANAVPLQVDFGRWTGGTLRRVPSAIFVFRGSSPSTVAVWVTNPTCSGNHLVRDYTKVLVDN